MNEIIDSSGWIEYFMGGTHRGHFRSMIHKVQDLIVPTITIFEVYKKILLQGGETHAITATSHMRKGHVIDLNEYLAIWAAKISKDLKLPMADSIILATAYATNSTVYTMDKDFKGIEGVHFISKV